MGKPYLYPAVKHRRKLSPGPFNRYRQYKPALQQEFGRVCIYCRTPDGSKGADSFGVEHYRPKTKFPALATSYENLFYACNTCNRRKGDYWPSAAELKDRRFVPNPCDHVMFDHIRFQGVNVVHRSAAGQLLAEMLLLDEEEARQHRTLVLASIRQLWQDLKNSEATMSQLQTAIAMSVGDRREELSSLLVEQESSARELLAILASLGVTQ